jgi:outer membrane murein-binding lipoprotein Lpp
MKNRALKSHLILAFSLFVAGGLIGGCSQDASKEPVPQSPNDLRADKSKMTEEDKQKMAEGMRKAGEEMQRVRQAGSPGGGQGQ